MEYRELNNTGMKVSTVGLGCWSFGEIKFWGAQDDAASIATVHAALDEGINFFDTAESYGEGKSEQVLGQGLRGLRDDVIIASKVSPAHLRRDDLIAACDRSLRNLNTDYIDLYQIHFANPDIPIEESIDALQTLRQEGKIRAVGVCNFGSHDLSTWLALKQLTLTTNQLPYNLLWRAIEYEVQPLCQKSAIGILAYSPIAQGLLTGKFLSADEVPAARARTRHFSASRPNAQHGEAGFEEETFATIEKLKQISKRLGESVARVALAWLLHKPAVTSVIAGARNAAQIKQNARAASYSLPVEVVKELDEATAKLMQDLGSGADMWRSDSRIR